MKDLILNFDTEKFLGINLFADLKKNSKENDA